jgi:hypothetical protein
MGLRNRFVIASVVCAFHAVAAVGSPIITFEPGDLNMFTLNAAASSAYSIGGSAGVGGGSGLVSTGTSSTLAMYPEGFSNALGTTNVVRIDYEHGTGGNPPLHIGFAPNRNQPAFSGSGTAVYAGNIFGETHVSYIIGGLESPTTITPTAGDWYRFEFRLIRSPTLPSYRFGIRKWALGADGTDLPLLLADYTSNFVAVGTDFTNAPTLYAGVSAWNGSFDNFEVPEPSAVGVCAVGSLVCVVHRRRRARPSPGRRPLSEARRALAEGAGIDVIQGR